MAEHHNIDEDQGEELLEQMIESLDNEDENVQDSMAKFYKSMVKRKELLEQVEMENVEKRDKLDQILNEIQNKISKLRETLEKLGYKDEYTESDKASASGTKLPNIIDCAAFIGGQMLNLYRSADAILKVRDIVIQQIRTTDVKPVKEDQTLQSHCPNDVQGTPQTGQVFKVNGHRDLKNVAMEQCAPADFGLVKEFLITTKKP